MDYGNYFDCQTQYEQNLLRGLDCTQCQYITQQILDCEEDVLGFATSTPYLDTFGLYCSDDVILVENLKGCWKNG